VRVSTMVTDTSEISQLLRARDDSILVLVVSPGRLGQLLSEVNPPPEDGFRADLSVSQYRSQFEPDLSESRIRELCAANQFPDSEIEAGEVVPGAYKNSRGEWQITMEGIRARQRRERAQGLERRKRQAEEKKELRRKVEAAAPDENHPSSKADNQEQPVPHERPTHVARPTKGRWRESLSQPR
jgi:hypothetical protein